MRSRLQQRAARFAGFQRDHTPTIADPFTVVLVDEVAFLTAYQPDRKLRERIMNALATLTTQGRAVGYCVVAALQDPRKEVLTIRNLFPDRIAMRLDEPEQVDMVLGDGARDRGAACELISYDPATGAGVAFVRLESDPDPVRVRAGWVSDVTSVTWPPGATPTPCPWKSRRQHDRGLCHLVPGGGLPGMQRSADRDRAGGRQHHPGMPLVQLVGLVAARTRAVLR